MIPAFNETKEVLLGQAITHGATATANWDCQGGQYAVIDVCLSVTAGGTNGTGPTISVLHGDDTNATDFTTAVANVAATKAEDGDYLATYYVDLRGRGRYLRVTVTPPSGSTNSNITWAQAVGTLTRLDLGPQNTTDMVASTSVQDVRVVG
jgi:hypothetical protein